MHAQGKGYFEKFKKCRAYEQALELKAEGLIRHVGLSFHDKSEVLDEILTEYPQMEFVQLQLHYTIRPSRDGSAARYAQSMANRSS